MSDSDSRTNEVIRGNDARRIIKDPLVVSALKEMEQSVVDRIAVCPPENEKLQQKLCMMLGTVRVFAAIFQTHVETGKMAERQLAEWADGEKRKKFGVF